MNRISVTASRQIRVCYGIRKQGKGTQVEAWFQKNPAPVIFFQPGNEEDTA